jgi:hypothetical protein
MAFLRYVKEAFNARPWGMWVPPNWIGLGAMGILGFENYGFWILGAGLELGYLLMLSTNGRFQHLVDARDSYAAKQNTKQQIQKLLVRLDASDQNRYRTLEARCQKVLEHQQEAASPAVDLQAQAEGLSKLLSVYLRLLLTRAGILRVLEGSSTQSIDVRILDVNRQLQNASNSDLQRSLTDQLAILTERKSRHTEARQKLQFIEAELSRIQEQVELIREGLVVTTEPAQLSRRIDQVGDTLGGTTQWIKQQQELLGETEELLEEQAPVVLDVPASPQKALFPL